MHIRHLCIAIYPRESRWRIETSVAPSWEDVEVAIRQLDDELYPYIELYRPEDLDALQNDQDPDGGGPLIIFGGNERWTLLSFWGDWQFENADEPDVDVRFWQRDQGYFCSQQNTTDNIEIVLRIAKDFFENGLFERLEKFEKQT